MAKPLTFYVDGACLLRPKDGVGSYASSLLNGALDADGQNQYIALGFADQRGNPRLVEERDNFRYHFLPLPKKIYSILFKTTRLSVDRWLPQKADAVWYPNFVVTPFIKNAPKVVAVHDLTYLRFPETVERKNLAYLRRFVPYSIKTASAITTVSQAIRAELIAEFKPSIPTQTIYPIIPPRPSADLPRLVLHPYILFVGTLEPRKNIALLLEAFSLLPPSLQQKYPLVLAGREGWLDAATKKKIMDYQSSGHIQWLNGPTDSEIQALLAHASLFVMPSMYEGFGIPALEALQHGVAIITSNDPALVEVTGSAALHVRSDSAQELSDAMRQLLQNAERREALAATAPHQLALFNAQVSAKSLIDLLCSVSQQR